MFDTAIAKAAKASDKYIAIRTISASPEIKNPNHPLPPAVSWKGAVIAAEPPATPTIMAAANSGLTRNVGKGDGQQTGTVKQRKMITFTDADVELRLKHELKKTPTAETRIALLTTSRTRGKMALAGMQPAKPNTAT